VELNWFRVEHITSCYQVLGDESSLRASRKSRKPPLKISPPFAPIPAGGRWSRDSTMNWQSTNEVGSNEIDVAITGGSAADSMTNTDSPLHSETSVYDGFSKDYENMPGRAHKFMDIKTREMTRSSSSISSGDRSNSSEGAGHTEKKSRKRASGGDNAAACRRHRLRRKIEREELQKRIDTMVEERDIYMSRIADLQSEVEALRCAGLTTDARLRMENELLRMQVQKMRNSVSRLVKGVEQAETQASDEETAMLLRGCQDSSVAQVLGIGYGCYDKSWLEGRRFKLFPEAPYTIGFRYQLLPLGCDRESARRVVVRFDMPARDHFCLLNAAEMFRVIWGSLSDPDFLDRVEHDIQGFTGKIRDITPSAPQSGVKIIAFDNSDKGGQSDARLFSEAKIMLEPCFDGPSTNYTQRVEAFLGCSITAPTNLVEESTKDRSFLLGQIVRPAVRQEDGTLCTSIFSVPCNEPINQYVLADGSLGPAIGERLTAYAQHLEMLGRKMMQSGQFPAIAAHAIDGSACVSS